MAQYQPISRRPIASIFRTTAARATRWCVRHRIHADAISYSSIVAAIAAAVCFAQSGEHAWLLLIAPLFCYLRLWFNMLDGMVALEAGNASPRGEILNDLPDRVSDVLIFAGVAQSGLTHAPLGYWAAMFALLTAYVGTLGQAVAGRREFGGLMSKPWRMVVLHVGAWIGFFCGCFGIRNAWRGLTILDLTCLTVIAGCVQTIAVRLARTMTLLRTKSGS